MLGGENLPFLEHSKLDCKFFAYAGPFAVAEDNIVEQATWLLLFLTV